MTKYFIKAQGCVCNIADSKKISEFLKKTGNKIIKNPDEADEIIVVSCGFNELKLNHSLQEIKELESKNKKIKIAGCIPKIRPERLTKYEIIGNPRNFEDIERITKNKRINKIKIEQISPMFYFKKTAYIKISTGCNGKCSYCAIKQAVGYVKSRSIKEIVNDVNKSIKKGYKKIALISDDIGSWGRDKNKKLSDLIKELITIEGDFKILLTSIHPKNLLTDKEILKLIKSPKIGNTIYLPNQSASDNILKKMKREHTHKEYLKLIDAILKARPDMKIQTDLIIGFPTETEEDHQKNLQFIKNSKIYFLQAFMYTSMKRTISEQFTDLDEKIKESRTREIIKAFLNKNNKEKRILVNTNIKI